MDKNTIINELRELGTGMILGYGFTSALSFCGGYATLMLKGPVNKLPDELLAKVFFHSIGLCDLEDLIGYVVDNELLENGTIHYNER
ncbi:hypothetical protein [Lutispora sp.]|uniref:hypothetical protein n=1 Tax=Lutispora sp. TaxID=2828727 RepID=UPI003562C7D1